MMAKNRLNVHRSVGSRVLLAMRQLVVLAVALAASSAWAQSISVESTIAGQTPRVIGLNSGNYLPESNTTTWWNWSKVNGARIFTSAPRIEPIDDIAPHGDGVTNESQFLARRSSLRADPLNTSFINWPVFENNYATNDSDYINYDYAYDELSSNGIKPLAMINRTSGQYAFSADGTAAGWGDRWEHWQHYYAQAFYLGSNYDVERYSMYNEPDQSSQSVTQADYLQRLQFASDAIQSAISDVNQMFGKQLEPQILAPITAGASNEYLARLDNSDTRDDVTGWGELVVNNLHTNFLGETDPNFQLVHTYAYQEYNHDGPRYAEELSKIKQYVADDAPGEDIGFGLTEFNVHSNGVFSGLSETLDSPSKYSRLGAIFASLTNEQPDELYLFKMSSNAEDNDLQKNAIFHNSRFDAPYDVGGASSAAAALRLFTTGFAGAQTLHDAPDHKVNNLYVATSYNEEKDYYYWFSANEASQNRSLQLDLSAWGIEPGTVVQVEEVGEGHLAEVTQRITVPASRTINVNQSRESVLLLSVPSTVPDSQLVLTPTDDAMVKAANNGNKNYGSSDNLTVKNVADSPNGRNVSFIRFDASDVGSSTVERAVLELHGENRGTDEYAIAHVYGVLGDGWDESTLTWNTATNLADTSGVANLIAHNFVEGINDTAEFVGHLTVDQDFQMVSVDVTDFLFAHPDDIVTFLIAREVRFDGENVDDSVSHLRFASKDRAGDFGPRLLLDLRDGPLAGDFNDDGLVDSADYTIWRDNLDAPDEAALLGGGDGENGVDIGDYLLWKTNFGATNAPANIRDAATARIPEPSNIAASLLLIAAAACFTRLS